MIKKVLNNLGKSITVCQNSKNVSCNKTYKGMNTIENQLNIVSCSLKLKYSFARKVSSIVTSSQATINTKLETTSSQQTQSKQYQPKQTQHYTFIQLQKDLQMYQQYLSIFNTHTKKPHQKLLKNQLKIISSVIQAKRQDLLVKFLSTNYKNRLANSETLGKISAYYRQKLNNRFDQMITDKEECQGMLEVCALLTEYNQLELFDQIILLFSKKLNLDSITASDHSQLLLNILDHLPSQQCQILILYNSLIRQRQLPESIMQSKYFGLHTQGLKFNNLGETFYQIRKFVRRYFSIYSKKVKNHKDVQDQDQDQKIKSFERQFKKTSHNSIIQNDVACFLKTLKYDNVRKEIEIDGFVVDFVVDGVRLKWKGKEQPSPSQSATSTILEVMGSHHYTSTGKLKAKDIRKLILLGSKYRQKKYSIKLIHYDDYNKSRGHRNKMELIKNLLESTGDKINWEPQNKGHDSKWQLNDTYDEFK